LRDIGRESLTYGALQHELAMIPLFLFPVRMLQAMMYKGAQKVYQRIKEKESGITAADKKTQ